jgi:hypothetical protein
MPRTTQTSWDQVPGASVYGSRPRLHPYSRATRDPDYFTRPSMTEHHSFDFLLTRVTVLPDPTHPFVPTGYDLRSVAYQPHMPPSRYDWNYPGGSVPYQPQPNKLSASRSLWRRLRLWTRKKYPPSPILYPPPILPNRRKRETLALHPLLTANTTAKLPVFLFNVSQPPTAALVWHGKRYNPLQADRRPIVTLPSARCLLTFTTDALSGHVLDVSGMSLDDLLWELYDFFQTPLTASELRSPAVYQNAVRAMERRCAAVFDPENEWARGLKRIDCLGQRVYLKGVRLEVDGDGDVCLSVSFMRRDS